MRTELGPVIVTSHFGRDVEPLLPEVAKLRIEVFREFPYLYEGSLEYEETYLRNYAASDEALVVVARYAGEVVGVSTAMPVTQHSDEVVPALLQAGFDPARFYYFGESVLRHDARGRRIGHAFFDHREAAARSLGRFTHTGFCSVVRPHDHSARPAGYVPHDAFWTKRGYVKRPGVMTCFRWKDLGEAEPTDKPMVFWTHTLAGR